MSRRHSTPAPAELFLFWGNQSLELEEEAKACVQSFLGQTPSSESLLSFDLAEVSKNPAREKLMAEAIQQAGENINFFSPQVVIWLSNLQALPAQKSPVTGLETKLTKINLVKLLLEGQERWVDADSLPKDSPTHNHTTARNLVERLDALSEGGYALTLKPTWPGRLILQYRGKAQVELPIEELLQERLKEKLSFERPHPDQILPTGQGKLMGLLLEWIEEMPSEVRLILTAEIKNLRELPSSLAKALEQKAKIKKLTVAYEDDKPTGWVIQRAKAKGLILNKDLADLLIELVGTDFRALQQELEKLSLQSTAGMITAEQILTYASRSMKYSVFRVGELLGQRNLAESAQSLEKLLFEAPSEVPALFGLIAMQFRKLLKIHWLQASGAGEKELAEKLKLHPFLVKRVLQTSSNFQTKELENIILHLASLDLPLKYSKGEALNMLENLAFMICTGRFRSSSHRLQPVW